MKSFSSASVYAVLAILILAGGAAYGVFQYRIFDQEHKAIESNAVRLEALNRQISDGQTQYQALAEASSQKHAGLQKKLSAILPEGENYTDLTRQLDNYFAERDSLTNPILQSSLAFNKGVPVKDMPGLSALPMTMNIEATRKNFFHFLEYVSNSGTLESGTRLMDIKSVNLNFSEGGELVTDQKQKINFLVQMSAYYQTPKK
ncbi:hypothetical protein HYV58_00360 [Candidatus Peregrinibacteria bacterium]|nr:hypothetical protein [Candidatus Peregrinibacteria bacterium]